MLIGIFLSALGVSFSVRSMIGASPIGSCPAVFSQFLGISTGTAMAIMLMFFLIMQVIILKKDFAPMQILQLAISVLYGFLLDLFSGVLAVLPNGVLWQQMIYSALGIMFLGIGVFTLLRADLFMLPPDALAKIVCDKYQIEYGKVKSVLDGMLAGIAVVGSFILYGKLVHVGIGTVAAAILIGMLISKLNEFKGLNRLLDRMLCTA